MVLNEESIDSDFRVEGNGDANLLFVDAGNDKVGIGTSSPQYKLHLHEATSGSNYLLVTNSTTGSNNNDGLVIGLAADESALIYHQESAAIRFGTASTERMRIDSSGNIMAGKVTADPANDGFQFNPGTASFVAITNSSSGAGDELLFLRRNGLSGSGNFIEFNIGTTLAGSISASGSSTAYNTSSDHRLKQGVEDMAGAIDRVKALAPKRFQFIADPETTVDGFLAHEAQTVVPEAVTGSHNETEAIGDVTDADGNNVQTGVIQPAELEEGHSWTETGTQPVMQGIDQSKLVPLLTGALREAIAKIETLETQNTTQATQIADLITRVTALEAG
jgi:hypothetical protein